MEQKNNFLHKKLPELQKSEEVQDAVDKHIRVTGEKVSNNPEARLEVYMDRLEKIFLNEDEETRKRNIEMLRDKIHDAFVIKREDVPESYFELQKRVARERGEHIEEIPQSIKEQMIDVIIEDQVKSLDSWVDYLSSDDAVYPTWFKYFAFRNIVKLSQFDKELGKFKERTRATTAPFPDIYREALAQVSDLYESASRDKTLFNDKDFQVFLSKKFPTQYADKIQQALEHSQENKEQIEGQWVKYEKGNEEGAKKLFESLQSKGTGWCTAGQSTALTQIKSGDFYVFYTNDKEGNPTTPRLAIRMNGTNTIGEVRGVLPHQEVEPMLQEVLDDKLSTFGSEADKYKKKSSDMKHLTSIEKNLENKSNITKDDILFLFEISGKIEGFGYERDPRIYELRSKITRENTQEVFNLKSEEIADNFEEITDTTILYLPELGSFLSDQNEHKKRCSNIKHLTSIEKEIGKQANLSKEDVLFLFESTEKIEIFEFRRGPKVWELRKKITKENIQEVFNLKPEEIANDFEEITDTTILYFPELGSFLSEKDYEKEAYTKLLANLKELGKFCSEIKNNKTLSKDKLRLLYEIDNKTEIYLRTHEDIENLRDILNKLFDRIKEERNLLDDFAIIFECSPKDIVMDISQINGDTRVFLKKERRSSYSEKENIVIFDLASDRNIGARLTLKKLDAIEKKKENGEIFTKEDLEFIWTGELSKEETGYTSFSPRDTYEITLTPITGYSSEKICPFNKIRSGRSKKDDISFVFGYNPDEVITDVKDINENTKAYFNPSKGFSKYSLSEIPKEQAIKLSQIAKKMRENNSKASIKFEIDQGISNVEIKQEALKDLSSALDYYMLEQGSYEDTDDEGNNPIREEALNRLFSLPFTTPEKLSFDAVFIQYDGQNVSIDEILKDIDKIGLRPATFAELLALGINEPHVSNNGFTINALGSSTIINGRMCIPLMEEYNNPNYIDDDYYETEPYQPLLRAEEVERVINDYGENIYLCVRK